MPATTPAASRSGSIARAVARATSISNLAARSLQPAASNALQRSPSLTSRLYASHHGAPPRRAPRRPPRPGRQHPTRSLRTSLGRLRAPVFARADARFAKASASRGLAGRVGQRCYLLSDRRRSHDRCVSARCGGAASLAGDDARLSRRPAAAQQGHAATRPTRRPSTRSSPSCATPATTATGAAARDDRRALARRTAHPEALALTEHDLDPRRGSVLVRRGKGGRRREVGMDEWGWEQVAPMAEPPAPSCPPGRCFASSTAPPAAGRGRAARSAASSAQSPRRAGSAPVRAAPAASRARARARARGRAAEHHPAPARAHQPRHDLDLPARHRSRGDPRRGPRPAGADDVRQRRATALSPARQAGAPRRSRFPRTKAGVHTPGPAARADRPTQAPGGRW